MISKFRQINLEYDNFYKSLLKEGKIATRETEVGTWGISVASDIYSLFRKINLSKYKNFIDLGSGDGKVVLIASLFTNATGIEYDFELHIKSVEIRDKLKLQAELFQGDFLEHDLSKYDVIFMNPDKGFHTGVEDKLLKEMEGILIVYNAIFKPRFLKEIDNFNFDRIPTIIYRKV